MSINLVSPGDKAPNEVNVIIEIPAAGAPVKYEVDKKTGMMSVDRFMSTSMYYPCNYGYIPGTLSKDGDPVDVLVITPVPLISGSIIRCRPVAVLEMTDESGEDAKLLAVPVDKLTPHYRHIKTADDVSADLLAMIQHFFEHYKDLEPGKWVKVKGWAGPEVAQQEILESIARYKG